MANKKTMANLNWVEVYDSEEFMRECGGLQTDPKKPTGNVSTVKGSVHVHSGLESIIPNVACKIRTTHDLSKRNPIAYVKLIERAKSRGLISETQYDSLSKNAERIWTETSPIIVLPGERDGMMIKVKMGQNGPEGQLPVMSIHEILLSDIIDQQYRSVCDFLDKNPDIKKAIVENSFPTNEFNKSVPLIEKPAAELVVHPLKTEVWDKDTKLQDGTVAKRGSVKTNVARTFTLKPMIKKLERNAKNEIETKVRGGEFIYNASNGDDVSENGANAVWGMATQVPASDATGKRYMAYTERIKDVRTYMYVKPDNRKDDTRIKVPNHAHFYMKTIPDKIGTPMLQCSKGEINLQYYVSSLSIFAKVETGGSMETETQRLIHSDILNEIEKSEGISMISDDSLRPLNDSGSGDEKDETSQHYHQNLLSQQQQQQQQSFQQRQLRPNEGVVPQKPQTKTVMVWPNNNRTSSSSSVSSVSSAVTATASNGQEGQGRNQNPGSPSHRANFDERTNFSKVDSNSEWQKENPDKSPTRIVGDSEPSQTTDDNYLYDAESAEDEEDKGKKNRRDGTKTNRREEGNDDASEEEESEHQIRSKSRAQKNDQDDEGEVSDHVKHRSKFDRNPKNVVAAAAPPRQVQKTGRQEDRRTNQESQKRRREDGDLQRGNGKRNKT